MIIVPVSRRAASTRAFERLFDDAFDRFFGPEATNDGAPVRRPALDVSESDTQYTVTLDVPGVRREDVQVSIDGRKVAIVASAEAPAADVPQAEGSAGERVLLRERTAARFARSFTVGQDIDEAASQARLDNGVLTLTLAKRAPATTRLTVN